jgi:Flp pilus assembly protein TadG
MRSRTELRPQRGTQIVELAILLPLLVFLTLLISEGVGIVHAHQVMTNAARESARMAILPENATMIPPNSGLQDAASCYMARNNVFPPSIPTSCSSIGPRTANCNTNGYSVTITSPVLVPNGGTNAEAVRVSITCGYRLKYFRLRPFNISPTIPLSTSVLFPKLY